MNMMVANLKTIVAVTGALVMLASPRKTRHHSTVIVPADAYGSVVERYAPAQTVYAPNLRLPARPYQ
jgi:hypothetical protein